MASSFDSKRALCQARQQYRCRHIKSSRGLEDTCWVDLSSLSRPIPFLEGIILKTSRKDFVAEQILEGFALRLMSIDVC